MQLKNKQVNFWPKIFSRFTDLSVIFVLSSVLLPVVLRVDENGVWYFGHNYLFYVWSFYSAFLFFFFLVCLPALSKGYTIGNYFWRIKIVFTSSNLWISMLKKEVLGALGWIAIIFVFSLSLNHTMILKLVNKQDLENLSVGEDFRLSLATTFSGLVIICQIIISLSPLVQKNKVSWNDLFAKTRIVYVKRFVKPDKTQDTNTVEITPQLVKDEPVEWIK